MLSGDNGILYRTTIAKTKTDKAQIIEKAKLGILAQVTDNKGKKITKAQLITVLNTYFKPVSTSSIPDSISTTNDVELTTIDEKYTINLSEIYSGNFTTTDEGIAYVIGDYVTINGEGFYVIENSPTSQTTVKILSAKNVNTSTNKQSDNANSVIFDNSTSVYANSSIKGLVDSYVSSLGVDVETSKLMSIEDLYTLGLVAHYAETTDGLPSFAKLPAYWLLDNEESLDYDPEEPLVWFVSGGGITLQEPYNNWSNCGLRPVIEILKSNISN